MNESRHSAPAIGALKAMVRTLKEKSRNFLVPYWWLVDRAYQTGIYKHAHIPIIINSFNRLETMQKLVAFLEKSGLKNIVILDNNSSYPPLLSYLADCPHTVVRLDKNYGHLAFWTSGLFRTYRWNYFVYTDPDLVPVDECPHDFLSYFRSVLTQNSRVDKVGFGIKIDDLPDSFNLKDKVIRHEQRHWEKEISQNIFDAPIDTTFALYRPLTNLKGGQAFTLRALRCGFPYLVRHMPWYVDSERLSEEDRYYVQTSNNSSSIGEHQRGTGKIY